jgi:tripartite ATP-independent transporter DctM subunit
MFAFFAENLAPIMFLSLIVVLLAGYPVAFALAFVGFVFGFIGIEMGLLPITLFGAIPDRIFGQMSNETLLAIPFFTFMGLILERSGMAEDLLDTIGQLFGPVRGGLAFAVIFVGAILAATTGVVAASVISMGLISLPIMLRYGYDRRVAAGTIAASGTLAQIIPPSLVLIILADQLGRSVGDMYKGALIPGLLLVAAYAAYIITMSMLKPQSVPALPPEARTLRGWKLLARVVTSLVPPLVLIFLVLGTIFIGLATPTEGGAMGAAGALVLAAINRRLDLSMVKSALYATAKLSSFVIFILLGARVFSLTFYGVNGHVWVEHLMTSIPGGAVGFLIVANLLVFFLAFFLDYFELAFIIIPLLAPVADALGIDLIWFGVMLAINMQTSFMHPPFRLLAVLPAIRGADACLQGSGHRGHHPACHLRPDLHGRPSLPGDPARHGHHRHRLPAIGDTLQVRPCRRRSIDNPAECADAGSRRREPVRNAEPAVWRTGAVLRRAGRSASGSPTPDFGSPTPSFGAPPAEPAK